MTLYSSGSTQGREKYLDEWKTELQKKALEGDSRLEAKERMKMGQEDSSSRRRTEWEKILDCSPYLKAASWARTLDETSSPQWGQPSTANQVLLSLRGSVRWPRETVAWEVLSLYIYIYDINEDAVCFGIFKANDYVIYATNAKSSASALGVNKLTDLRQDKLAASYTGFKPMSWWSGLPRLSTHEYNRVPLVYSVVWMTQGVVTPVKDHEQCSSCWSFSTTGALVGAWALSTGNLASIRNRQFVDCDITDSGCNGGWMDLNDCVNDVQVNSFRYCSDQDEINDTVSKSFIRVDMPLVTSSCSLVREMTYTGSGDTPSASLFCYTGLKLGEMVNSSNSEAGSLSLLVRSTSLKTALLALPTVSLTESARVTAGRVKVTPGLHRLRYWRPHVQQPQELVTCRAAKWASSRWSRRLHRRVRWQRADFDVNSGTATHVYSHWGRSVPVSVVLLWRIHRFMRYASWPWCFDRRLWKWSWHRLCCSSCVRWERPTTWQYWPRGGVGTSRPYLTSWFCQ